MSLGRRSLINMPAIGNLNMLREAHEAESATSDNRVAGRFGAIADEMANPQLDLGHCPAA